jgi:hypothetical protein
MGSPAISGSIHILRLRWHFPSYTWILCIDFRNLQGLLFLSLVKLSRPNMHRSSDRPSLYVRRLNSTKPFSSATRRPQAALFAYSVEMVVASLLRFYATRILVQTSTLRGTATAHQSQCEVD